MLLLPHSDTAIGQLPLPSDRLSACDDIAGFSAEPEETLAPIEVPAVALDPRTAFALLRILDTESTDDTVAWGHDARWWNAVSQFTQHLINDQRVIPTVVQERNGSMFAAWRPWLQDAPNHSKFTALVRGAPALVRAAEGAGAATTLLEQSMGAFVDSSVRDIMELENYSEALDGRDPDRDPHVAWLTGLLSAEVAVRQPSAVESSIVRTARQWIANLEDIGKVCNNLRRDLEHRLSWCCRDRSQSMVGTWRARHTPETPSC
jgi:hypothetical protein